VSNPFAIDGPAVISFSGGRTSGYMLRRILDEGLRPDVHILFADTGRERVETYEFIRACAHRWAVAIEWVERPGQFTQLITDRQYLPNPIARFCTSMLKLQPIRAAMIAHGYDHWLNVVGIRADEPARVARLRGRTDPSWDVELPLADAGVTAADVLRFWQAQPFDLALAPGHSNCDLCFLKSYPYIKNMVRERPDLAEWWAQQEERIGGTFRNDRPSYRAMLNQPDLFKDTTTEDLIECYCHD
jgi:3'-phosphoadenosine 5'-phosphosulfate sulfotransferase (PAPS reductase)/FAD synthetase